MSTLGKQGAMGNQLFQYAALFSLSRKTGFEMKIPEPPNNVDGKLKIIGFFNNDSKTPIEKYDYALGCFNISSQYLKPGDINSGKNNQNNRYLNYFIKKYSKLKIKYQYNEPHFHFDPKFFKVNDGTDISGYFQSEKYFAQYTDEIRKEFTVKSHFMEVAKKKLKEYANRGDKIISLHVRRVGHEKPELQKIHKYPDVKYYLNAMEFFRNQISIPIFLFFSDDIKWCKSTFRKEDIVFSENNSPIIDFTMMSKCDHNIITPSSFSWWASWLNRNNNKVVIAPDGDLFGPKGPKIQKDYLPENIIRISKK